MSGKQTYKLTYFNSRGNGEIARLMLKSKDVKFEDERIGDNWSELKPKTPLGQLPVLTVTSGSKKQEICQTGAISKYLAKKLGFMGKTDEEAAEIDEAFGAFEDVRNALIKIVFAKSEEDKATAMKGMTERVLAVNKFIGTKMGKRKFIVGDKMSLADFAIFSAVEMLNSLPSEVEMNNLQAVYNNVLADARVKKWVQERPQTKN